MSNLRYSKQRELVLDVIKNTNEHPTAETIYSWLKPENPTLSLGTVYRNLTVLVESGSIIKLSLPIERYDFKTAPHSHFICQTCGTIYDLEEVDYDADLDELAANSSCHRVDSHELFFKGTCTPCLKNMK